MFFLFWSTLSANVCSPVLLNRGQILSAPRGVADCLLLNTPLVAIETDTLSKRGFVLKTSKQRHRSGVFDKLYSKDDVMR